MLKTVWIINKNTRTNELDAGVAERPKAVGSRASG